MNRKSCLALAAVAALASSEALAQPKPLVVKPGVATKGKFASRLRKNGAPLADDAVVVLSDGTKMSAKAYRAVVDGYLNSLERRGLIDAKGARAPVVAAAATVRAEQKARAAATSAAQQVAKVKTVALPARGAELGWKPLNGARVPLANPLASRETWSRSWSASLGDADWVGLDVAASHELCSSGAVTYYDASLTAGLTVRGRKQPLVHGSVTATATPGLCALQGDLELAGQTFWTLRGSDARAAMETPERTFPVHLGLTDFEVPTSIVPVRFRAWLGGAVGFAGLVRAQQNDTEPKAFGYLLSIAASSRAVRVDAQNQLEGAFALVSLSGQASVNLDLADVADEFGIAGDIVRHLGLDVNLGGASGTLSVDLLRSELRFAAENGLDYYDDGSTQRYVLDGGLNAGLRVRALQRPRLEVAAWINVPTGISIDFVWDVPPVEVSIDWTRLRYDHVWGSDAVGFDANVPILGERWTRTIQETHLNTRPSFTPKPVH